MKKLLLLLSLITTLAVADPVYKYPLQDAQLQNDLDANGHGIANLYHLTLATGGSITNAGGTAGFDNNGLFGDGSRIFNLPVGNSGGITSIAGDDGTATGLTLSVANPTTTPTITLGGTLLLSHLPVIPAGQTSGFATVATSGNAADLTGILDDARLSANVPLFSDLGSGTSIDLNINGAILQNGNVLAYQGALFYPDSTQLTDANKNLYTHSLNGTLSGGQWSDDGNMGWSTGGNVAVGGSVTAGVLVNAQGITLKSDGGSPYATFSYDGDLGITITDGWGQSIDINSDYSGLNLNQMLLTLNGGGIYDQILNGYVYLPGGMLGALDASNLTNVPPPAGLSLSSNYGSITTSDYGSIQTRDHGNIQTGNNGFIYTSHSGPGDFLIGDGSGGYTTVLSGPNTLGPLDGSALYNVPLPAGLLIYEPVGSYVQTGQGGFISTGIGLFESCYISAGDTTAGDLLIGDGTGGYTQLLSGPYTLGPLDGSALYNVPLPAALHVDPASPILSGAYTSTGNEDSLQVGGTTVLSGPNTLGPLDGSALSVSGIPVFGNWGAEYFDTFGNANYANYANSANQCSVAYTSQNTFDNFFHAGNYNTDTSLPGDTTFSFGNGTLTGDGTNVTVNGSTGAAAFVIDGTAFYPHVSAGTLTFTSTP